jgi:hypothetical protein
MAESDLAEITEIIKKIEERTIYKDTEEEEKYKTQYEIQKKNDFAKELHIRDGTPSFVLYESDKFKKIKEEYSNEENKVFLDFLKNKAEPTIQSIIEKSENKVTELQSNSFNQSNLQGLYTRFTGNKNSATQKFEDDIHEAYRLEQVNNDLRKIRDVIKKLIKVYQPVQTGGKYKTRRNINKKYKKSVKKYKKSYRRR